jgi:tetratricopeptide (TPR) repeat protein
MSQPNLPQKVLVVDDDLTVLTSLEEALGKVSVKVDKASSLDTALYLFNQQRYDVVLIEIEFAPLPGLALVQKWRKHENSEKQCTAFIMMSGNKNVDGANSSLARELGELETIAKPFGAVQILPFLARGLATKKRALACLETKSKVLDYYSKTGDFDKAAAHVQKQLPALGQRGLSVLCDLYEKGGRHDDALNLINGMVEKDPNNIALLNSKGRLLMKLGRYAEAKDVLLKSDQLAPQNIERINELATAYLHLKDPANAVKKFKEIVDLSPEAPELKFDMFSKLYEFGFDDQAVQFGKESAQPMEIVRHYNNKGVLLAKEGNSSEAQVEYQRALRYFPKFKENYRIYFNIALANLQHKTREGCEEAIKCLKTCLELAPDFDKAKHAMEQAEKLLEKTAQPGSTPPPAKKAV